MIDNLEFNESNYISIDTETSGLDDKAEIVQLAAVDWNLNTLFYKLLKPIDPIPEVASNIHGITNEDVKYEKPISYYWEYQLSKIFRDKIIIGYNVMYDIRMIMQSLARYGLSNTRTLCPIAIIDVMQIYKISTMDSRFKKLTEACETQSTFPPIGTDRFKAHDALYDATMTMLLFQELGKRK